ncbi:helicase HerA-like domain-containing protein [Coxiella burnetii]|uniref:ATPase n=1 Tax=Coxiella burnetii (strain RSA 493 / Nine Mile phase I) TaxID=227377 RepID=Q83CS6_COXBU|nr:helicase HerA-like domain-containing protein [Coxiella burnetii]NP_820033.1 ATPase [Coxiella burnetii RSA 493]AAO90547.1 ATPase [Coxiella burnetii RSA 493]AML49310.1 ATPase [Coxiella burnetii]AML55242.1 ATPase [Coxiella burnetii]ARI65848.1 ATPase [Coxiella burnetii]ARK27318.1 ATPase [Coxiella burnetii]
MEQLLIAKTETGVPKYLNLTMTNRHGLITGATGTGKTVTLQRTAEQFSKAGVPVFTTDVKGDLSGIGKPPAPQGCPVIFWDLYGHRGHPLRATISEVGPLLLSRFLNANDVQQGIINAAFNLADEQGLLLLDLKDFRALLTWMSENASSLKIKYGNISSSSVGALQRSLLTLAESGGDQFFGEPSLKLEDLLRKDPSGKGVISILDATTLINDGRLYSTFLLWLLSELFEQLPEVGDLNKPKLIFFFDEAHLLFNSAPKILLEKINQMVRLIRSKAVGVYFATQSPLDIPESVLGQLGNRVQHALRAFTPKDQKAVKNAAQTFRQNPQLATEKVITQLKVGEALVSFLDSAGSPEIVEKVKIMLPESHVGALSDAEREKLIINSSLHGVYDTTIDRESAYEVLEKRMQVKQAPTSKPIQKRPPGRPRQSVAETLLKSTARTVGSQIGRQIIRGLLGSVFKGKK